VTVDELDGIFHRDDMALPLLVDLVDDRGERSGLARAGRPGHQDQTPGFLCQLGENRREAQVLEGPHIEGNHADNHGHTAALLEHVAAESGQVLNAEREVQLVFGLESLLLVFGEDRIGEREGVLGRQHVGRRGVGHVSVNPEFGPLARCDMEV
jgi:hypothetical protein